MAPTKRDPASKASSSKSPSAVKAGRVTKSSSAGRKGSEGFVGGNESGGGDGDDWIGPPPIKKEQKMKWNDKADIKLLTFGIEREIKASEHEAIAASFKEKPTAKAIQERLTKLRAEQAVLLKDLGLYDIDTAQGKSKKGGKKIKGKGKKNAKVEEDEELEDDEIVEGKAVEEVDDEEGAETD